MADLSKKVKTECNISKLTDQEIVKRDKTVLLTQNKYEFASGLIDEDTFKRNDERIIRIHTAPEKLKKPTISNGTARIMRLLPSMLLILTAVVFLATMFLKTFVLKNTINDEFPKNITSSVLDLMGGVSKKSNLNYYLKQIFMRIFDDGTISSYTYIGKTCEFLMIFAIAGILFGATNIVVNIKEDLKSRKMTNLFVLAFTLILLVMYIMLTSNVCTLMNTFYDVGGKGGAELGETKASIFMILVIIVGSLAVAGDIALMVIENVLVKHERFPFEQKTDKLSEKSSKLIKLAVPIVTALGGLISIVLLVMNTNFNFNNLNSSSSLIVLMISLFALVYGIITTIRVVTKDIYTKSLFNLFSLVIFVVLSVLSFIIAMNDGSILSALQDSGTDASLNVAKIKQYLTNFNISATAFLVSSITMVFVLLGWYVEGKLDIRVVNKANTDITVTDMKKYPLYHTVVLGAISLLSVILGVVASITARTGVDVAFGVIAISLGVFVLAYVGVTAIPMFKENLHIKTLIERMAIFFMLMFLAVGFVAEMMNTAYNFTFTLLYIFAIIALTAELLVGKVEKKMYTDGLIKEDQVDLPVKDKVSHIIRLLPSANLVLMSLFTIILAFVPQAVGAPSLLFSGHWLQIVVIVLLALSVLGIVGALVTTYFDLKENVKIRNVISIISQVVGVLMLAGTMVMLIVISGIAQPSNYLCAVAILSLMIVVLGVIVSVIVYDSLNQVEGIVRVTKRPIIEWTPEEVKKEGKNKTLTEIQYQYASNIIDEDTYIKTKEYVLEVFE